MKAVVLAAGEGLRLRPLTLNKPKHLIPVGGKPLLEHLLLSLKAAGLDEALIVVHYFADQIKQYFGDGSKIGMKLEYTFQKEVLGTADATLLAKSYVKKEFLLVYGDLLITPNVVKVILQSHKKMKPSVSMAVVKVKHPERYGVVKLTDSYVTDIIEKPRSEMGSTQIANAGIYAFSTNIFEKITKTQLSPRGECELTDSLRLLIHDQQSILAVQIPPEEWHDVGRPWDLLEANQKALSQIKTKVVGQIEDGAHILGPVEVAEGTRVRSGAYIEGPVFIDEKSDIGPNCFIRPYTSIGKNVRVGNACEIKNSILMDKTRVGHLSYVGDSVIGEDCNLGAGTLIANYRLDGKTIKMSVKDEIVDSERSKLGAIIGDQVKTGINALLMPGVKIGPKSWIGPNVVVDEDVSSNEFLRLKQSLK